MEEVEYTELQVTTNFTFLHGASHPEELVDQALRLGYKEIGITDRNTLAGVVRAYSATKGKDIRLIVGCRLDLVDGPSLLAYPTDINAYARLCNLLTIGNRRTEKGQCLLHKKDVYAYATGMLFIVLPPDELDDLFNFPESFKKDLLEYKRAFSDSLSIAASRLYNGDDLKRLRRLSQFTGVAMVATNDVHYHIPDRRELQDVLVCIREKCKIENAGYHLFPNGERYLKAKEEIARLFRQYPEALQRSQEIAAACTFSLDQLRYNYPSEITSEGRTPQEELVHQTWKGAHQFFGPEIPEKIVSTVNYELDFIERKNYAVYFLTVFDIVRYARSIGILCQGRGSAANSAVCYCLGITPVDPSKIKLLFERFMSEDRDEVPDIDVDFEHSRREEVMQYIFKKFGRDRAAIVATVTCVHEKGAIRDIGPALGLSIDTVNQLSKVMTAFSTGQIDPQKMIEEGLNPYDPHLLKVIDLTWQYIGHPRQLGQHTGGFVITNSKLCDLVPIQNARMENRTVIEWNKDDIEVLGFLKVDVLALGILTCIRKAFDLAKKHKGLDLTLANIPVDEPKMFEMISRGDTIGVFQVESRAQQAMLPRLRPNCYYDLVIQIAIVRPGPIQGGMVHPYLRRRRGQDPIVYPSAELEDILGRTLGVPLFQEQAMAISITAAGFTGAEADQLRRAMATFKIKQGIVTKFREKLISGMVKKGYTLVFAEQIFSQLEGFGSYGFPESHAASFAHLVAATAWLKCFHPDIFFCAMLNSYPLGFYAEAQLVGAAVKDGVQVRPVDVNLSLWDHLPEEKSGQFHALRLGFRIITGMHEEDIKVLVEGRGNGFTSVDDLRNAGISDAVLELLANADAFRSIGLDRREALWAITNKDTAAALFTGQSIETGAEVVSLPAMSDAEHVVEDYSSTSLSLKAHPLSFIRPALSQLNIIPAVELSGGLDGNPVKVAGLVIVRQRPGTAKGVCFVSLEDETGQMNLVVFPNIFFKYRKAILQSELLMVEGKLQKEGELIHVIVSTCYDLSTLLRKLTNDQQQGVSLLTLSRADEGAWPNPVDNPEDKSKPQSSQLNLFQKARNFK